MPQSEKSDTSLFSKLLYEKIKNSIDWILKCQNLKFLILAISDAPVVRNDLTLRLAPQTPKNKVDKPFEVCLQFKYVIRLFSLKTSRAPLLIPRLFPPERSGCSAPMRPFPMMR